MSRCATIVALLLLSGGPALAADAAAAGACAAKLPPNGRLIYDAVAPSVKPDSDLKSLVPEKVRPIVMSGKLDRATAQAIAPAAGECLLLLK
jgi:hypothetical protein